MEVTRESAKAGVKVLGKTSKCSVETNTIVPDKYPDILKILQVDATCSISDKTLRQGRITVEGKIHADIMYLPDGETGVKVIPTEIDFSDVIDCPNYEEGMHAIVSSEVSQVEINLVNSRKITIQASVSTDVEVIAEKEIEYISSINSGDAAYKCTNAELYSIVAHNTNLFVLKEEVELPSDRKEIECILKCDSKICDKEVRASGNKVIVKGAISTNLLYCDSDNRIDSVETSFPFTEVFEVPELCGDEHIDVKTSIKERKCANSVNQAGEVRVINYEFLVELELFITKDEHICYISDCYFYGAGTDIKTNEINVEKKKCYSSGIKNIREIIPADKRLPKIASVYNVVTHPVILSSERDSEGVIVNGKLDVSILYLSDSDENPVCCHRADIPLSHKFNVTDAEEISISGECEHITYALTSNGDIELRAAVELRMEDRKLNPLRLMTEINKSEKEKNNEIIIFFSDGQECVWDIAKRYKIAPEYLASLNNLDEDTIIEKGRKVIIPI